VIVEVMSDATERFARGQKFDRRVSLPDQDLVGDSRRRMSSRSGSNSPVSWQLLQRDADCGDVSRVKPARG
jgi:hypothetical protein